MTRSLTKLPSLEASTLPLGYRGGGGNFNEFGSLLVSSVFYQDHFFSILRVVLLQELELIKPKLKCHLLTLPSSVWTVLFHIVDHSTVDSGSTITYGQEFYSRQFSSPR